MSSLNIFTQSQPFLLIFFKLKYVVGSRYLLKFKESSLIFHLKLLSSFFDS